MVRDGLLLVEYQVPAGEQYFFQTIKKNTAKNPLFFSFWQQWTIPTPIYRQTQGKSLNKISQFSKEESAIESTAISTNWSINNHAGWALQN